MLRARGNQYVQNARPNARAERVGSHVQPSASEVKPDRRGHPFAKNLLPLARIEPLENRLANRALGYGCAGTGGVPCRPMADACGDGRNHGDKLAAQLLE